MSAKAMNATPYVLLMALLLVAGCDFLKEEPEDFVTPGTFYKTASDAQAAVTAIYGALANTFDSRYYRITQHPTDESFPQLALGSDNSSMDDYTFTAGNSVIAGWWDEHFTMVNRANAAIVNIPDIDMDPDLQARLVGEARFLRALFYFDLVRSFGGVPLRTAPTESLSNVELARASEEEVYQLIIEDLQAAEEVLPVSESEKGRATQGAATALLAKVYLTRESWQMAATKAKEVIDSGTYGLLSDYAEVFRRENTEEHIFSIQYEPEPGLGNTYTQHFAPLFSAVQRARSVGQSLPEEDFYNSFDTTDVRWQEMLTTELPAYDGSGVKEIAPTQLKFFDPDALGGQSGRNLPFLRYADVLLMYAEALNEQGGPTAEAYGAINAVRDRAGLEPLSGLSQAGFRDAVIQERSWELFAEGHRWYDLTRTRRLIEVMGEQEGFSVQERHYVFPIPQVEIDVNTAIEQNPGY